MDPTKKWIDSKVQEWKNVLDETCDAVPMKPTWNLEIENLKEDFEVGKDFTEPDNDKGWVDTLSLNIENFLDQFWSPNFSHKTNVLKAIQNFQVRYGLDDDPASFQKINLKVEWLSQPGLMRVKVFDMSVTQWVPEDTNPNEISEYTVTYPFKDFYTSHQLSYQVSSTYGNRKV